MNFNWKKLSINDLEKNYNPREAVFNFSDYIEKYKTLGKEFRKKLPCILDVSYGDTPLQKLDIFGKKTLKNASVHIFIHGGYWRALDKSDHSQLANPFVENNILYFSINHDLCPAVTLSEIIQQVNSAIIWIYNNCKNYGGDKNKITISGHSAGAHLCAMILENNWKNYYLPPDIIKGAALISGIYQPEIVLNLSVNKEIKLSKNEAIKNTPESPKEKIPIILTCVGDQEPEGWIEQTKLYSKNAINMSSHLDFSILNDENHFSMMISFSNSEHKFVKKLINMAKI